MNRRTVENIQLAIVFPLVLGCFAGVIYLFLHPSPRPECQPEHRVTRVAQAPDGATLWRDECLHVLFSSRGAENGKPYHYVPNRE